MPLALFIHGGWWRSLEPSMFSQLATGPNAHGVTRRGRRLRSVPGRSIANIIEQMRDACLWLWRKYKKRIFIYGHSAGGHLAACMLAQDWKAFAADAPADLVPAAYAISGVFDLAPLVHVSQNADLRLDAEEARRVSPLYWKVPAGRTLDAVVGALEFERIPAAEQDHRRRLGARGVATRYEEIAGANHFTVVDPLGDPGSAMTRRVVQLAEMVAAL